MSSRDKIRAEIAASEQHPDAPADTKWTQPGQARSVVYSVRLNADEVARVEQVAQQLDVPPSTLVRGWILDGLAATDSGTVLGTIDHIEANLRQLRAIVSK